MVWEPSLVVSIALEQPVRIELLVMNSGDELRLLADLEAREALTAHIQAAIGDAVAFMAARREQWGPGDAVPWRRAA